MHNGIVAGLAFTGGFLVGGAIVNRLTIKALDEKYNKQMEAEIARTRKFYERVNKAGDYATPESAAEALGVPVDETLDAAADAVKEYSGKTDYTKFAVREISLDAEPNVFIQAAEKAGTIIGEAIVGEPIEEHNVFEEAEDIGFSGPDPENPEAPYIITMLEFAENDGDVEQLEMTYYAGDRVLTDDQDKPVQEIDRVIGSHNLERFGTNRVIYVRNPRLKTDFEVNLSDGKYAYEVAGFTHGDEMYERNSRRRRSADE